MKKSKRDKKITNSLGEYFRLSVALPLCILISFIVGRFLDNRLGTSPIFLIIFIILGITSFYVTLFKSVRK